MAYADVINSVVTVDQKRLVYFSSLADNKVELPKIYEQWKIGKQTGASDTVFINWLHASM